MKQTKLFISIIFAGILLFGSLPAAAVYETPIDFSEVKYYDADGVTEISAPQEGKFYVQAEAIYTGGESRQALMLCAFYEKTSGIIQKIAASDAAVWPGESNQMLKTEISISQVADYEFRYYFIDNLTRHTPLSNQAPGAPGAVSISDVTVKSARLGWEAAEDDFRNITGYRIYKNGMQMGETTDTSFLLPNLMRNSTADISVRSDDGKLISVPSKATVSTVNFPLLNMNADNKSGDQIKSENLYFIYVSVGAGSSEDGGVQSGMRCIKFPSQKYPGFTVNTNYISENDRNLVFEITYLDQNDAGITSTPVYMQSVQSSNPGNLSTTAIENPDNPSEIILASSKPIIVGNTGVWKTEIRTMVDCAFTSAGAGAGEFYKNFRLYTTGGSSNVYAAKAAITKKEDYIPMNPNMTVDGGMIVYGMNFATQGGYDAAYTIETMGGEQCAASAAAGNLAYTLTKQNILSAAKVNVEVMFYDDTAGDTLYVAEKHVPMTGAGWRHALVQLDGSALSAAGSLSFRTESGNTVYLKEFQAYAE